MIVGFGLAVSPIEEDREAIALERQEGPVLLAGVPADYDPMPILRNLETPQLWILGADDHESPSAETGRRLRKLLAEGKPITVAVTEGPYGASIARGPYHEP